MDKKINTLLQNLIQTVPEYNLSEEERKTIQFEGIEKFIFNKLTSTKYRLSAVGGDLSEMIQKAIAYNVKNKLPIRVLMPFGAYKLWKLPTQPYPDWAEVFNIIQLREYLSPIAKAYKHGVTLRYFSVELFVERNNHIPQADLDKYQKEFLELLKYFRKYLPNNFKLEFKNLREYISQEEALAEVDKKVAELKKEWENISKADKELKIKRAEVNCKVAKDDPNYNEIIKEAVHVHDAFSSECWVKPGKSPWDYNDGIISIGYSYTAGWAIHVKSSRSSRISFWVGMGALIKKGNDHLPTIISYKQYEKHKAQIVSDPINIFEDKFINLQSVPILNLES